jgi:serine/threonine protein kinase
LLELLHGEDVVHTNLNPDNIFLRNEDTAQMCFQNLHHCSWDSAEVLKIDDLGLDYEDNLSLYDIRTRNKHFVSPEQIDLNNELARVVMKRNGKIVENSYDVQEFLAVKQNLQPKPISKLCDIYAIGAIIFKLILGRAPTP